MSLVELRQAIKGTLSVYKTTSAMRMLSMSLHLYAKKNSEKQEFFVEKCEQFLKTIAPNKKKLEILPYKHTQLKKLFVFIGSQKGLCGSYNFNVADSASQIIKSKENNSQDISIIIGKKLAEIIQPSSSFLLTGLNKNNLISTSRTIHVYAEQNRCDQITFVCVKSKNLFSSAVITPSIHLNDERVESASFYSGHFAKKDIIDFVQKLYISASIEMILGQAFLSEQAARFVSMDSASKNAEEAVVEKRLQYNKLRKMSITKELQDLIGNWI